MLRSRVHLGDQQWVQNQMEEQQRDAEPCLQQQDEIFLVSILVRIHTGRAGSIWSFWVLSWKAYVFAWLQCKPECTNKVLADQDVLTVPYKA